MTAPEAGRSRTGEDGRRILAMGGGGFTMGERSPALDRFVLELTGRPCPRICFLPTASGDPREQVLRFHERFEGWPCEPSSLSLFHLGRESLDPHAHLLSQDAIYVGGGSMRNMLAVWREHGIDATMREAWHSGVVLAGLSAGAMCWFEGGISKSGGRPEPARGLGLLPGSLSVHLDGEPERGPVYRRAVSDGELPPGHAADDGAALVFHGPRLAECVASRPDARVVRVAADGAVAAVPVRVLAGASVQPMAAAEASAVAELRELHAHRRGLV